EQAMSEHAFRSQLQTHAILGYASNPTVDPSAPAFVGDLAAAEANGFSTIDGVRTTYAEKRDLKRRRKPKGNLEVVEGSSAYVGPWGEWDGDEVNDLDPDDVAELAEDEGELEPDAPPPLARRTKA